MDLDGDVVFAIFYSVGRVRVFLACWPYNIIISLWIWTFYVVVYVVSRRQNSELIRNL